MTGKVLLLLTGICACVCSLQLKQVLVLSRHNLRTPLTSTLARMTPKKWPKWDGEVGELTLKGALLESHIGNYFAAWLHKEGLFPERCPEENSVHIYANTRQRTKATAKAFAEAAFKNCNVKVNFENITEMDPTFNPVLTAATDLLIETAKQEMQDKLNKSDLNNVYLELNSITDIKNSEICKEDGYCDLSKDENKVVFEIGFEPNVIGPLFIGNSMVDSFLMSFYEGLPLEEIGWGFIKTEEQWDLLTRIIKENQNVRFNLTSVGRDLALPLVKYMKDMLESDTKFTFLVGHDSNLSPILSCMRFRSFVLPEQHELTPVGGKLVFQKWTNVSADFLKVEFVYQSRQQLRNADPLSLENPPQKATMYLKDCLTDENGFCPWSEFEKILNDLVE